MSATAPIGAPAPPPAVGSGAPRPRKTNGRAWPAGVGWVASAAAVLAAFVLLGTLAGAIAPTPSGPPGSMFATTPQGLAAYAELLDRGGHPVAPLRTSLARASLPPTATLVIVDAADLSPAETERLRAFVRAGGTLLLAGGNVSVTAAAVLLGAPRWVTAGTGVARSTPLFARASGVTTVLTAGPGTWRATPGVIERPDGGALLVVRVLGRGGVELLADASPLENRLLRRADNAALGLVLAGSPGRPVLFAEALHGYGVATGLAAIPPRWWVALGGLAVAGGLWALSRGRRLGPPEPEGDPSAPARSRYLEALATALVRSRDREGLAELARTAGVAASDPANLADRGAPSGPRSTIPTAGADRRERAAGKESEP